MLIIPPTDINTCVCKFLILAAWNKVDSKEVIQAKGNLFFGAKLSDPDIESRHFVMKIVAFFYSHPVTETGSGSTEVYNLMICIRI